MRSRIAAWRCLPAHAFACAACLAVASGHALADSPSLLSVSYDAIRELYTDINPAFVADWKVRAGETVFADGAIYDQIAARR